VAQGDMTTKVSRNAEIAPTLAQYWIELQRAR
jgi:hypothetical protein